jgi:hypothetical protein
MDITPVSNSLILAENLCMYSTPRTREEEITPSL